MKPDSETKTTLGSPVWVIFVTFLIFLISQVVVAPATVLLGHFIFNPGSQLNIDKSIPAQFFFILIAEAGAAWISIKIVKRHHLGLKSIGLGRWPAIRDLWQALLGFGAFYLLLIIAGIIINIFVPNINLIYLSRTLIIRSKILVLIILIPIPKIY
ncbi:hypothetical protein KW794_02515 [Candidatus Saccharibacteria bacterium]|nr:hypothetical protein [Candidatus Saccharibacteria bacterium]